jgi:hypothetical protein
MRTMPHAVHSAMQSGGGATGIAEDSLETAGCAPRCMLPGHSRRMQRARRRRLAGVGRGEQLLEQLAAAALVCVWLERALLHRLVEQLLLRLRALEHCALHRARCSVIDVCTSRFDPMRALHMCQVA